MAPFDRDKTLDQPSSRKLHNSTDSEQIKVVMQAQTINETSFLTLPGELRNCIYEEVIEGLGVNPNTGTLVLPCRGYGCKGLNFVWMKEIVSSSPGPGIAHRQKGVFVHAVASLQLLLLRIQTP